MPSSPLTTVSVSIGKYVDTTAVNNQTYYYWLVSNNSYGNGPFVATGSVTACAVSSPTIPTAPQNLTRMVGSGNVKLTWISPTSNGGSNVDYYVIFENGVALSFQETGLSLTIDGLTNGMEYDFTIAAHNLVGVGPQ